VSEAVRAVVSQIRDSIYHRRALRILILGDPQATTCRLLALDGHDVWCCPDRQCSPTASHLQIAAKALEDLPDPVEHWDLVVAVDGFERIQQVHRVAILRRIMGKFAQNSRALLVEAPRRPLAPDLHDLGPYLTSEYLADYLAVTEIQVEDTNRTSAPPLLLASNEGFFASGEWLSADSLKVHPPNNLEAPIVVRTFEADRTIIKVELASEGFFDECAVVAEGEFLQRASTKMRTVLGLPRVLNLHRGRAINVLVRERITGEPLSPGICARRDIPLESVIDVACHLSGLELFHNDFRPWNLLWNGAEMRVIDFANVSDTDSDVEGLPQVLALAGTLASLASPELPWGPEFVPNIMALANEAGVFATWTEDYLLGETRSPWLAISKARDAIVRCMTNPEQFSAHFIVAKVVEEIMSKHLSMPRN
jgi:hypothetical protein